MGTTRKKVILVGCWACGETKAGEGCFCYDCKTKWRIKEKLKSIGFNTLNLIKGILKWELKIKK